MKDERSEVGRKKISDRKIWATRRMKWDRRMRSSSRKEKLKKE